jgi:putative membrane protein
MTFCKICRVAGVAIAVTLFGAGASAAPAVDDHDSAGMAEVSGDPGPVGIAEDALTVFNDLDVAAVMDAINTHEILEAHVALVRSYDVEVRAFALKMIVDHAAMKKEQKQLLERLSIVPRPNRMSARIEATSEAHAAVLALHTGRAFDILYLHAQIEDHRTALDLLDKSLISSARASEFHTLLLRARPKIAEHLDLARQILVRLGERE